jgi:hypothetical protein
MALGSTQPLAEMSTRNLPGVKSGRSVGLITLPPSMSRKSVNVGAQPLATLRASTASTAITLPLLLEKRIADNKHNEYITQN